MNDTVWVGIAMAAVFVSVMIFWAGATWQRKTTLLILRGHESDGKTIKEALDYEQNIAEGKKAWEPR